MDKNQKTIEKLKDIIRKIEFVEYEDSEDGLIISCPYCGGSPETLTPEQARAVVFRGIPGHTGTCKIAQALYGDL